MPNIYKLENETTKKLSKTIYTRSGAKDYQKKYDDKNIKTKVVVYKQNVVILDNMAEITGIVESFREANQSELIKIAKKKGKKTEE